MTDKNSGDSVEFIEDEDFSGEASVKDKMKKIRDKLKRSEEEKKDNLAGWQRAQADLINYKKQVQAERPTLINKGVESVLLDLLPVIDAFYMAMKNKVSWEQVDSNWRNGVEYIYNQLLKTLEDNEARLIKPEAGDKFDDGLHEASNTPSSDDLIISELLRPGLMFNNKVLRHASVELQD